MFTRVTKETSKLSSSSEIVINLCKGFGALSLHDVLAIYSWVKMPPSDLTYGIETSRLSDPMVSPICIGCQSLGPSLVISMRSGSFYIRSITLCAYSIRINPFACASSENKIPYSAPLFPLPL
jgi:hypothetical protein